MKNMKKLLAALMAVMVFVMAAPAVFAEDAQTEQPAQEQTVEKAEAPKAEPKAEEPKAEEPKAEEPKAEETAQPEATQEAAVEVTAEDTAQPEATPEATAQPEATPEATAQPETTPEATAQPEATPAAERSITVEASESTLKVGDTLKLTAKLTGFDGIEYKLNWQVKAPGEDWKDISGEHGETLKVELDAQSVGCAWRVVVETAD